ncbi:hypothetical protein ACG1BZ_16555 [Microbulbifer sp. CNSA002]|uniref:hypothetical protein n=1 Tax=Microbulbifer sp. CNSA002 TaxID=3373604 RepID=UPI0039B4C1E5
MIRMLFLALAIILLVACDAVDDMKGMFEKQKLAQAAIKEKYGWDSQLGFSINNGVLTQVTVVLDVNDVRGETVKNLEVITKEVVSEVFKSKPKAIYIQIASIPNSGS